MPRRCTICAHADREAIERAIAADASLRNIAERYGTTPQTLMRHRDHCIAPKIVQLQAVAQEHRDRTVRDELEHLFVRVHKLLDACDAWLTDPEDESRYDLGPRAEELQVIHIAFEEVGGRKLPVRKKESLSTLLEKITKVQKISIERVESRHADPRSLVLSTAAQLTKQVELLAKLTGELDERPQVNILVLPEWLSLQDRIITALAAYPPALEAVRDAIAIGG